MQLGRWDHAERAARGASRAPTDDPRLAERLARLDLARNRPHAALTVIERCRARSASLRLLRAVCLLATGRAAQAHLDLLRWSRSATAPTETRVLLAALDWRAGDPEAACAALRHNLRAQPDVISLELLMLLSWRQRRPEHAQRWAQRLLNAAAFSAAEPEVDLMLRTLGLSCPPRETEPGQMQVATLALELTGSEEVIPALVDAQRRELDAPAARLLSRAIEKALPDLLARSTACEALARLSLLLGEVHAAQLWARRALQASPLSVTAALLLEESSQAVPAGPAVVATIGAGVSRPRERAA